MVVRKTEQNILSDCRVEDEGLLRHVGHRVGYVDVTLEPFHLKRARTHTKKWMTGFDEAGELMRYGVQAPCLGCSFKSCPGPEPETKIAPNGRCGHFLDKTNQGVA